MVIFKIVPLSLLKCPFFSFSGSKFPFTSLNLVVIPTLIFFHLLIPTSGAFHGQFPSIILILSMGDMLLFLCVSSYNFGLYPVEILDVYYVPPKSLFVLFCVCEQLTRLNSTANPDSGVMGNSTNPSSLLLAVAGLLGVCHVRAFFVARQRFGQSLCAVFGDNPPPPRQACPFLEFTPSLSGSY